MFKVNPTTGALLTHPTSGANILDPAPTQQNNNRNNWDKALFQDLLDACRGGDAEHLCKVKNDDQRFSAAWPRLLREYNQTDLQTAGRLRAELFGSGEPEHQHITKILPDINKPNRAQTRQWKNLILLKFHALKEITDKTD